ncbi:MAG: hypothetical protein EZS28_012928 [Streblomastix strix]|uniref:Uncharacterized protein n=1 Tax=Streblomastix strix TaxID=222440 RepID=A0A5J4WA58_9EUKA|nr:MAG: hypothetical protein EZS28_012928 [Streblomastix strix]
MQEIDLNQLEKDAREKYQAEKRQQGSGGGGLMEIDGMEDDYDYYEQQANRQDRMKSRAKPFCRLPFHPSMIQRSRKRGNPQLREEVGYVLATLAVVLVKLEQRWEHQQLYALTQIQKIIKDTLKTTQFKCKKNPSWTLKRKQQALGVVEQYLRQGSIL